MGVVRTSLERFSRDRVLRRRLPARFGRGSIYVTPDSGLRLWRRDLEAVDPRLFALVDEFVTPGMRVWDIGANVGLFLFAAAHRAGPSGEVVGVEADIELASLLRRTARELDASYAPAQVLASAVSEPGARIGSFQIAARGRSTNALAGFGTSQMGGVRESQPVPLVTLDDLLARYGAPALVKMDIEGAEILALRGGAEVLARRPILHLEVTSERGAIAALLRSHGYRLFDADVDARARVEMSEPPCNWLALPA